MMTTISTKNAKGFAGFNMKHEGELIYLASPYSGNPAERLNRAIAIIKIAGKLIKKGLTIYSPIVNYHSINPQINLPSDWRFWQKHDRIILSRCDELWVCMLDGWKESKGVAAEIKIAKEFKIPVQFVDDKI